MSDWVLKSATLFEPLILRLKQELLKQDVIHVDETTVNVVKFDKVKSYMWLYCTGTDSPAPLNEIPNIVLFDYHNSRAGACVVDYLSGYNGYLQIDGYQAYAQTQATPVGCWAHARRKFIEAKLKGKTAKERDEIRQQQAKPILKKLHDWLTKQHVLSKTKLGEAITYLNNQWHKLIRYLENGLLNIDNNRAERVIKPFVIGRKSWLFSQTANGAHASAVLYSIIESAKTNGLIPFDYLLKCLDELCKSASDVEKILPWNINKS